MSAAAQRWAGLYLVLLLALAFIGVQSQTFHQLHDAKLGEKSDLNLQLSEKRAESLALTNPDEIRAWALRNGMISNARASQTFTVASGPLPQLEIMPAGSFEMRTQWR